MKKMMILFAAAIVSISAAAGNARYVNMFMGTAGDHGQVSPAAQVPFGLASVCPDCIVKERHAGYDFDVPQISGISVTRMSGTGGDGTGGNLRILPAVPGTAVSIVKGSEKAVPGFYGATLSNGVKVELTANKHCALERYIFPKGGENVISVDFNSAIDPRRSACGYEVAGSYISGWVQTSTVCNFGAYKLYFFMSASEPFTVEASDATTAVLRFAPDVREVEIRIGLSSIDCDSAREELNAISSKDFKSMTAAAQAEWDKVLNAVDVKGGSSEQRNLFYTSLYRVYLSPFDATFSGKFRTSDGEVHDASGYTFYSGWSMWDTYRTKFPMLCLLSPYRASDISESLTMLYRTGKRNWATMTEPVPTVRTEHSQVTLLDAWEKGINGLSLHKALCDAFPYMEAEVEEGRAAGARNGLTRNSPDQRMETVYDLWALSRIASIIGNEEAEAKYASEAEQLFEQTWKRDFMNIDDSYTLMRGNGLYQGTRWQYRWAVPVFAGKMSEWVGQETLAAQLDEFFARHLFNQGNEPDIQTPFMFHLFGHPEKTDALVHALLTDDNMIHIYGGNAEFPEPFKGRAFRNRTDGYAPEMDEDDGTMSAWYMFAQMGFYPTCPGKAEYQLFSPLFSRVTLHLNGHDVKVVRRCAPGKMKKVTVDGKPLPGFTITHEQLCGAHKIVFE
ncbi:MAG: GH92 family glycosyl hydrolase [Bacteroidales bacterium]|nr:GH92 family glycosyl hydrolase [Bacteroidales bacterium]